MKRVVVAAALLALVGCGKKSSGPCKRDVLDKTVAAARGSRAGSALIAAGLAEACRLPRFHAAVTDGMMASPPEQWSLEIMQAVSASPDQVATVCGPGSGGIMALTSALQLAPADGKRSLIESCDLVKLGFASENEMNRAPSVAELFFAASVHGWMTREKAPHARDLARLLIGLDW